jgi:hypothetical protein
MQVAIVKPNNVCHGRGKEWEQHTAKQHLSWTRKRVGAAHYKIDALLNCGTDSSDISGYRADFKDTALSERGRGAAWKRHGHGMLCVIRPLYTLHHPENPAPAVVLRKIRTVTIYAASVVAK